MDYLALREQLEKRGLLNKTPWYYAIIISLLTTFFATSWIVFYLVQNTFIRTIIVLILGFLCVHIGFIAHDAGHKAITDKQSINSIIGHITMTFINGISWSYWSDHHNTHHKDPNHPEDPDANYLITAFDEDQIKKKNRLTRFFVKHQSIFFVPMHLLTTFSMTINSIIHSIKKKRATTITEITLLMLHFAFWIALPGFFIGFWNAAMFYTIASFLRSLYFAMVFVPNHVGMPMIKPDAKLSFIEKQTITARNITPSWLKDFIFGGLNYQIEHHLFPNMPRKNLGKSREIVKKFCMNTKLKYEEVGFLKCYKDIFSHVHKISKLA